MMRSVWLVALVLVGQAVMGLGRIGRSLDENSTVVEGVGEAKPIIGGGLSDEATIDKFIFLAQLVFGEDAFQDGRCSGSLIVGDVVLTAASCVVKNDLSIVSPEFVVINPGADLENLRPEAKKVGVAQTIPHPDFNPNTLDNDLALLFLKEVVELVPCEYDEPQEALEVARDEYVGLEAQTVGFGSQDAACTQFNPLQKTMVVPVVPVADCGKNLNINLCAGFQNGANELGCRDAGAPLVVFQDGKPLQIGIASSEPTGSFDDYTTVAAFAPWIDEQVELFSIANGQNENLILIVAVMSGMLVITVLAIGYHRYNKAPNASSGKPGSGGKNNTKPKSEKNVRAVAPPPNLNFQLPNLNFDMAMQQHQHQQQQQQQQRVYNNAFAFPGNNNNNGSMWATNRTFNNNL